MNREIIEQYAAGGPTVSQAIQGLTTADMTAFPVPGTWSIQQIVLHLMDSDLIASGRMKSVIAEDVPLILNYDETQFAQRLNYDRMDPRLACELFALNRRATAEMLRTQPDEAFERTGVHSRRGLITLAGLVRGYTDHLSHHLKFLYNKRAILGKPLAH